MSKTFFLKEQIHLNFQKQYLDISSEISGIQSGEWKSISQPMHRQCGGRYASTIGSSPNTLVRHLVGRCRIHVVEDLPLGPAGHAATTIRYLQGDVFVCFVDSETDEGYCVQLFSQGPFTRGSHGVLEYLKYVILNYY